MARPKTKPAEIADAAIAGDVITEDLAAHDARAKQLAIVDKQYGEAVPYQRERLISEARFFMATAAQALIELGRRLVVLREHEPHGEFIEALRAIGIDRRFAARAMQACVKYAGHEHQLAHLGKSKLLELLVLDDEQVDLIAEGGTVLGLTLDEVDKMSVSELRAELRKARASAVEEHEVSERLLGDKNKKIDELAEALTRRDRMPVEDVAGALAASLWQAAGAFLGPQEDLAGTFAAIASARDQHGVLPESLHKTQCDVLVWLMWRLEELRQAHGLVDVDLQSVVTPPWEQDAIGGTDSAAG